MRGLGIATRLKGSSTPSRVFKNVEGHLVEVVMGKDPAVLFYTSDFLTGTSRFTMEQRGQYISLLCDQHQNGHIPEEHMLFICGSSESPVFKKFIKDENGLYFNERMEEEHQKRILFSKSRSLNRKGKTKKQVKNTRKSYVKHMENENENENKDWKWRSEIETIVQFLNSELGTNYRTNTAKTKSHITARLSEGFTVDDFKTVIRKKKQTWQKTEWEKFLRPETLFGTKFESYLNEKVTMSLMDKVMMDRGIL